MASRSKSGDRIVHRLTEHWGLVDQLGMLVQLGVIQSPARVAVAV